MSLVPQDSVNTELLLLVRLLAAGVFGSVLGWEREQARKPAGLRTHIVVAIAAALFTVLAGLVAQETEAAGNQGGDPIRAIQAIAMGIGFLGGGVIFVSHRQDKVHGLTTAASIWATAAVGIAAGLAHYILAAGATLILVIVLRVLAKLEQNQSQELP
jgi:putative Mg2+ transporter-C (MgtC) family protein